MLWSQWRHNTIILWEGTMEEIEFSKQNIEHRSEKSKSFEDLRVWQKSHELVLDVYSTSKKFPRDERFGLTSQIRRQLFRSVQILRKAIGNSVKKRKYIFLILPIAH